MRIVIQTKFNDPELKGDCFNSFECNVEKECVIDRVRRVISSLISLNAPNVEDDIVSTMEQKMTFENHFINNEYRIIFVGRFANNNLSLVVKELKS